MNLVKQTDNISDLEDIKINMSFKSSDLESDWESIDNFISYCNKNSNLKELKSESQLNLKLSENEAMLKEEEKNQAMSKEEEQNEEMPKEEEMQEKLKLIEELKLKEKEQMQKQKQNQKQNQKKRMKEKELKISPNSQLSVMLFNRERISEQKQKQEERLEANIFEQLACLFILLSVVSTICVITYKCVYSKSIELDETKAIFSGMICNKAFADKHFNVDNDCCGLIYNSTCNNLIGNNEIVNKCGNLIELNKFFGKCIYNLDQSDFLELLMKIFKKY